MNTNTSTLPYAGDATEAAQTQKSLRMKARLFGVFFIFTFLSYGIGSGMVDSLTSAQDSLVQIANNKNQLVAGVFLMAVVHTVLNVLLATIMYSVVKPFGRTLAYGYLSLAISATVILAVGGVLLLMQIPLANAYQQGNVSDSLTTMNQMLSYGGFVSYQIGMALWGIGGVILTVLLCRSAMVPRFFPIWGAIGYLIFAAGTMGELFGLPFGVMLSIPGGLFEITLSVWLNVRGFRDTLESRG